MGRIEDVLLETFVLEQRNNDRYLWNPFALQGALCNLVPKTDYTHFGLVSQWAETQSGSHVTADGLP